MCSEIHKETNQSMYVLKSPFNTFYFLLYKIIFKIDRTLYIYITVVHNRTFFFLYVQPSMIFLGIEGDGG